MKKILALSAILLIFGVALVVRAATEPNATTPKWSFNGTLIEACSCPMFCQCFFNTQPAGHHNHGNGGEEHFCRANIAYRINRGSYGNVPLAGAKFWFSGDLGSDFSKGETDWAVVTFDRSVNQPQRDAILAIMQQVYPVKWKSFNTAEGVIDKWEITKEGAHALLDGGKTAEVELKRFQGMTNEPVTIKNLRYMGAPRNDGFILMPNTVEAYRVGPKAFEFKGTNGFLVTLDMNSNDIRKM